MNEMFGSIVYMSINVLIQVHTYIAMYDG